MEHGSSSKHSRRRRARAVSAPRQRADRLLVERGLFESRAKAQAAIEELATDSVIRASAAHPYVSRGGIKIAAALEQFGFDPKGCVCLDVGASTGGFAQVLLDHGAKRIYAVDVGRGQFHESLRLRPEITLLEATDIRSLSPHLIDEAPGFVTVDVSFISLKNVLPSALAFAKRPARLVALIKPQFEAGRARLKKGIVRDRTVHAAVCGDIEKFVTALGWRVVETIESPITGGDGNIEFLLGAVRD